MTWLQFAGEASVELHVRRRPPPTPWRAGYRQFDTAASYENEEAVRRRAARSCAARCC
ncbi:hypothetical protein [Nonomuraea endophytica]|uniref:Uncharacterized protein n=1 Tax=Nonomuraea endophytica TaxID=714136 RepID=A0A7W8EGR0_9ACTN|nr:hypothetical protein [Nonomuraea endophytica]MBB5077787.1 hypothetical protein [Nonomuraea endophytica]